MTETETEVTLESSELASLLKLGESEYQEAKRLKARLEERGVELRLVGDPEKCASGKCKVTVDVYARPGDMDRIRDYFKEERDRVFDGLNVDHTLLEEVFDPEKTEARCPACGTKFSTSLKECPDCGLMFG